MTHKSRIPCGLAARLLPALALLLVAGNLTAATFCVDLHGKKGCEPTISAAIAAASPGDVIEVDQGTYSGPITITKSLTLLAAPGAKPTINASGQPNGIVIRGIAASPGAIVMGVIVAGFEVQGAELEGILVVDASNITLIDNYVHDNDKALDAPAGTCPGLPLDIEVNEQTDCGEGIHLIGVGSSSILRNLVENNAGGILISDETGISTGNQVTSNVVRDNGYASGITLASHRLPPSNIVVLGHGVYSNVVSHNQSYHNGTVMPSPGAGIAILAPADGSVAVDNQVTYNDLRDNGGPGVLILNQSIVEQGFGTALNDNTIIGNKIFGNGTHNAGGAAAGSTGVNISSVQPISGTMIEQNEFGDESTDIDFYATGGSSVTAQFNDFDGRGIGISYGGGESTSPIVFPSLTVNAGYNWWGCATGPTAKCRSIVNAQPTPYTIYTVTTSPALTSPFDMNIRW